MRATVLALTILGISVSAPNQDRNLLLTSFVVSGKDAYFVSPSRLVLDGNVESLEFVSDRHAIISGWSRVKLTASQVLNSLIKIGEGPEKKPWIKVWDTKTDSVRDLAPPIQKLLMNDGGEITHEVAWTFQPGIAFVMTLDQGIGQATVTAGTKQTFRPTARLYKVDINAGTATLLVTTTPSESIPSMIVSPKKAMVAMTSYEFNTPLDRRDLKSTVKFNVMDFGGKTIKSGTTTMPGYVFLSSWTADGANIVGRVSRRLTQGAKPTATTVVLNITTGVISETAENIKIYEEDTEEKPIHEVLSTTTAQLGETKRPVNSLWIASPKADKDNQCLVASGVEEDNWLSPDLSQIAYVANGKLFASEILKVDLAMFLEAREAAERYSAMSDAKQIATGTMIYSADYDDEMPPVNGFEDSVMPYLKNRELLNGFIYTYNGGPLTGLKDPSNTEIGYKSVSGGRCVAYADGSVRFIKNK